jgi:hypothetical protein
MPQIQHYLITEIEMFVFTFIVNPGHSTLLNLGLHYTNFDTANVMINLSKLNLSGRYLFLYTSTEEAHANP